MKINEIIRAKRREQGMTQEQAAAALGVSASAVHKWEKGSSYPDITLLPALARLLGVDLNTLLSFQEDFMPEEIGRFCKELVQKVQEAGIDAGFEMAMEKIREYPASDSLRFNTASTLERALILYAPEQREQYGEQLEELYRRVAQDGCGPLRDQAQYMLASKKMERQDFAGAQSLLDSLPAEPSYDRAAMQATLYRKQGKRSEAAKLLESRLLHRANDCYTALLSLAEIAFEEGDGALADTLADTAQRTVRLYGLWEYSAYVVPFQLAANRKDAKQCLSLLQKMLPLLEKPRELSASPLYRHIKGQESTVIQEQMRERLLEALRTDEDFAFLREEADLTQLIEEFQCERK